MQRIVKENDKTRTALQSDEKSRSKVSIKVTTGKEGTAVGPPSIILPDRRRKRESISSSLTNAVFP